MVPIVWTTVGDMEEYGDKRGDGGWMYLHGTSRINEQGHLEIGGCDTVDLAKRFGTPLYVMDEALIRQRINQLYPSG